MLKLKRVFDIAKIIMKKDKIITVSLLHLSIKFTEILPKCHPSQRETHLT